MDRYNDRIMHLFPTSVMLFDMSNHPCKAKALEIIDASQTDNHPLLNKGKGSFKNNGSLLSNPELTQLKNDIQANIVKYSNLLGTFPLRLTNNWFNIMEPDGTVNPHRHEGSVISGAYYIRAPEGSSSLHFSSPLAPLRMNQLTESSNPLNVSEYAIPCAEDLLILFPSWLEHYTDKNNNDLRTVISFNTHYAKTFF
jgi:uncharacterized protein (TIGR02466 family)